MLYLRVNRRSFLASATGAALMVALPGCASTSGLSDRERRALLRMARSLYPHDALGDETYLEALDWARAVGAVILRNAPIRPATTRAPASVLRVTISPPLNVGAMR